jgi:hypothetical protein
MEGLDIGKTRANIGFSFGTSLPLKWLFFVVWHIYILFKQHVKQHQYEQKIGVSWYGTKLATHVTRWRSRFGCIALLCRRYQRRSLSVN